MEEKKWGEKNLFLNDQALGILEAKGLMDIGLYILSYSLWGRSEKI